MKTKFITKKFTYDGSQLRPHFAYENYKLLGNSLVSWIGPCDIPFSNMKDLEDVLDKSPIKGGLMLHWIVEMFSENLMTAVSLQRLLASIIQQELNESSPKLSKIKLHRIGDDLYYGDKKLSISIASVSAVSCQIHFAVNINNLNTPVKTISLMDLRVNPSLFAKKILKLFSDEFESIQQATCKVKPL